jgi:peptidoglycan/LPS O-acetylase OafA/YrhL
MYALALGAVIVLAVTTSAGSKWKHFWNAPILRFFGKYSYGMYVFQNFLKFIFAPDVIIASLTTAIGSIFLARCGYLVVMSIATIAAAIVSWHLLEKHFLRMKTKFGYKKREAKIA